MKYVMRCVPDITITDNKEKEVLIDYVYGVNILYLNKDNTLLIIETPLSDTKVDMVNFTDSYTLNLEFDTRTLYDEKIESKNNKLLNMKLVRKTQRYTSELKSEENVYVFYNGKDNIDDLINRCLTNTSSTDDDLYFAKVRKTAKIPTKDDENMGYDIYADFEEEYMLIDPHETKMIPTGICSACSEDYAIVLKERGSTGTKGMGQRCGVIDAGYRGEWFVPITNTTNYPLIISKITDENELITKEYGKIAPVGTIIYPYTKAICQAVVLPVPKMNVKEITYEELKNIKSKRGLGSLGSSGK